MMSFLLAFELDLFDLDEETEAGDEHDFDEDDFFKLAAEVLDEAGLFVSPLAVNSKLALGNGEETGDDLTMVVEIEEAGEGAFELDWNMSLKLIISPLLKPAGDGLAWLVFKLFDAEFPMKLNEDIEDEEMVLLVLVVVELDWLVLLSSLSVRLLKLKLKLLRLDSSRLKPLGCG